MGAEREEGPRHAPPAEGWTRRRFLGGLAVAGAAGLLGVAHPGPESIRLLTEGTIDADLGSPPEPQE